MKNAKVLLVILILVYSVECFAQEMISPYFQLGKFDTGIQENAEKVKQVLIDSDFKIIGEYSPENNKDLFVIAYTSNELIGLCEKYADRGMLAAVLKVGFVFKDGKTILSMLNPEYLFRAYIYEGFDMHSE